jgi:hypothetical protein
VDDDDQRLCVIRERSDGGSHDELNRLLGEPGEAAQKFTSWVGTQQDPPPLSFARNNIAMVAEVHWWCLVFNFFVAMAYFLFDTSVEATSQRRKYLAKKSESLPMLGRWQGTDCVLRRCSLVGRLGVENGGWFRRRVGWFKFNTSDKYLVISRAQGADFLRRRIVEGDGSNILGRIRGCHKLKSLSSRGVLVSIQAWVRWAERPQTIRRHLSQQLLEISSSSLALENEVRKRGKSSKVKQTVFKR